MISVIICTHNRCRHLASALKSLQAMSTSAAPAWELIVVDNRSSDNTRKVVNAFLGGDALQLRYVFESRLGLSHARNRGVRESHGELLSFLDDDVTVDPGWLIAIHDAFTTHDAACVAGKVRLKRDFERPPWWEERYDWALGQWDPGDRVIVADADGPSIIGIGANMSFSRRAFEKHGLFRTDLGRVGKRLLMGEEVEFYRRLIRAGERAVYTPSAVVWQQPWPERATKRYLRRLYFRIGQWHRFNDANSRQAPEKRLGIPISRWRDAFKNARQALGIQAAPGEAFFSELQLIVFLGYLSASIKRTRVQGNGMLARTGPPATGPRERAGTAAPG